MVTPRTGFLLLRRGNLLGQRLLTTNMLPEALTPPTSPSTSPSLTSPTPTSGSYADAITALNSLQTNAALLARVRKERQRNVHLNLAVTTRFLERSGMSLADLDRLPVIHVSGTKGKGSTCAFAEAVLRQSGLKTGFYSSPHLISATERIRINGVPLDEARFARYFWEVYGSVCRGHPEHDRPPYFKFLTILAFHVFQQEAVDVAVVEVGIGGAFDCTNIVRRPVVCGITALGLDHTSLLGGTIEEVAWHKAGIMKRGVTTYLEPRQPAGALRVVAERAAELGATVATAPALETHAWGGGKVPQLGLQGAVQRSNAAMGLALALHFLAVTRGGPAPPLAPTAPLASLLPLAVPAPAAAGLAGTRWPGRSQVVRRAGLHWCLDGAHTEDSVVACRDWWRGLPRPAGAYRVLLFNTTGERDVRALLELLVGEGWDLAVFCTNLSSSTDRKDQQNFTTTSQAQLARCQEQLEVWGWLQAARGGPAPALAIPCINDALLWVAGGREGALRGEFSGPRAPPGLRGAGLVQVLVTGSLHLVGGVLAAIQPDTVD